MKKIFIIFLLLSAFKLQSQDYQGFHTSSFAGVYGLNFNPAEIGDSRLKFHMNLIGLDVKASNNYVWLRGESFTNPDLFNDPKFKEKNTGERLNGNDKEGYFSTKINMPLSFMYSINSKNAIAVSWNTNFLGNFDGVSETLARFAYNNKDTNLYRLTSNEYFNTNIMSWMDIGVTYSRELINSGNHNLRGAMTLKYNQGLASIYMFGQDAEIKIRDKEHLSYVNGTFAAGASYLPVMDDNGSNPTTGQFIDSFMANRRGGWGGDLGFVYEHRDPTENYQYQMNCKTVTRNDQGKYKFKLGFSITDLGYVRFKRSAYNTHSGFFADSAKARDIDLNAFKAIKDGMDVLQDTLANYNMFLYKSNQEDIEMLTPTRINLYGDYRFHKWFYVNFTASMAPWRRNGNGTTHHITEFSITPRFEMKWLGVYLPLSTNHSGYFKMGTVVRLGPLVIGTNDITPILSPSREVYAGNVYMNLSIPIMQKGKARDKDKDGTSNRKDKCKDKPGPCENSGCPEPDKDGDGIFDKVDKCVDVPGLAELNGCPDKDGDKITDAEDKCPDVPGLAELNGCPDKDGDKITDAEDDCPELAGILEFKGCPDTDSDGIQDKEDDCPTEKGVKSANGCPDRDGDGLADKLDKCPDEAGPKDNLGCPYGDIDKDGVLDKDDDCPKIPGPADNKGCPKQDIKAVEKIQKAIDLAFDNLEFETKKDLIRVSSYPALNNLVNNLKDKGNYTLSLVGHTDNVGNPQENLTLSINRAEAVKKYLVNKGIDPKFIITEGKGDTMPIADNKTAAGRQKNRRVEMKAKF